MLYLYVKMGTVKMHNLKIEDQKKNISGKFGTGKCSAN